MNFSAYKGGARFYDAVWHNYTRKTLEYIWQALDTERLEGKASGEEDTTICLLDLACGTGELERRLVSLFPRIKIVALDNSPQMLSQARSKLRGNTQVSFVQGDVTRPLPFTEASFDYVVFANALHYMARPGLLLEEIHRVIKPGGQLIIEDFTVHDYFLWTWFEKLLRVVDPQHYRTYSLSELCRFVTTAGFSCADGKCFRIDWWWRGMFVTANSNNQLGWAAQNS